MSRQVFQSVRHIIIDEANAGQRVDNFLITLLKKVPKTRVYRIIRKGEVRVNRKRVAASYRLQIGDDVRVPPVFESETIPPLPPSRSLREQLSEAVLYEDDYLIVINKPAGVPVHGGTKTPLGVIEAMRTLHPEWPQLELAHRLDLETSGCLLLAKKRSALRVLHLMLREGKINKTYLALTKGHWKAGKTRVDVPLEKNYLQSGERMVRVHAEGKSALTVFRPLKVYQDATLVEAVLHTGRTHQIRVHALHEGHPLAGDQKYGDRAFNQAMRQQGLKRMFLHAARLEFVHPATAETCVVTAPLDESMTEFLQRRESK